MRLVIFGLTISSSWGNGHATLWRALCTALHARDHHVAFFERDVPYYAQHCDLWSLPGGELVLAASPGSCVRGVCDLDTPVMLGLRSHTAAHRAAALEALLSPRVAAPAAL